MNIQNNTHEMKIKLACVRWLEDRCIDFSEGILINEFTSNKSKSRADLVFASESELIAVEIKSEKDKITRLEKQIKDMKTKYNRVEVVVSPNHLENARKICKKEKVGLHVYLTVSIKQELKGIPRRIDKNKLKNSLFPKSEREKADFNPTEDNYRRFIINKYKAGSKNKIDEINENYVRSLNPNHEKRIKNELKKISYRKDLKDLFDAIQSTQSSSKSEDEISRP